MSRAFVKNDAADDRILVPPRAPLPPGTINYVTHNGLVLLKNELAALEADRTCSQHCGNDEAERIRQSALLTQRIAEIAERITSAKIVDPQTQPRDEVRFGATVTLLTLSGKNPGQERRVTIVGVDEAEPSAGRISFVAPVARAIQGCQVGETVTLRTAQGEEVLEIRKFEYLS
ncbi:MAG: transcription elongation factor GreAB [Deltaproteobacteria bacterium]|nr:transcription elongation factor GreAB [Deltaproteobacteria bacterium]